MPKTLFVSYSHQDEHHKDFVVGHLKVAERQGVFDVWDDRRIKGGGDWQAEIDEALVRADIAVLLISRHCLTSDFIVDHEVRTILKRHASDDVIVYPILISDCTWQSVDWLKTMNMRPADGTPLGSFNEAERDKVMADIASEITALLHPADEQAAIARSAPPRLRPSSPSGGILDWWQGASVTARATVLGTVFAGLALLWGVAAGLMGGGDNISVNGGSFVGGDVINSDIEVQKK